MRCRCWAAVAIVVLFGTASVAIDGGEVAGATVPRASSGVDATTRAARDLLAYVPTAVRGRCTDSDVSFDDQQYPQAIVTSYSAELDCTTAAGEQVFYTKFDNRAGADAYLETIVTVANYAGVSSKLSDCPSETTYSTTEGKKKREGGRVFCFLTVEGDRSTLPTGTPVVTWTDEQLGIVGEAWNLTHPDHVHHFFAQDAGPLTKPDRSGIPALPTAAALRTQGKSLLALVPAASARGCKIVNDFSRAVLGDLYVWRLWMVAAVEACQPKGGPQEVGYVRFANTDAMNEYYADTADPGPAENAQALHGITCPGTNSYKADGRQAGGVKCYFASIDTNGRQSVDQYFHMVWSSKPTKVVASAISPGADERAVMDWWSKRGGPNVK